MIIVLLDTSRLAECMRYDSLVFSSDGRVDASGPGRIWKGVAAIHPNINNFDVSLSPRHLPRTAMQSSCQLNEH